MEGIHFRHIHSPSAFVPELRELLRSIADTMERGGFLELQDDFEGSAL